MTIKMNKKTRWPRAELDAMVEQGMITKHQRDNSQIINYRIKNGGRWHEMPFNREQLQKALDGNITLIASRLSTANEQARAYALLNHEYDKLFKIALDAGAIEYAGKKCPNCGSTNTTSRSQRHMTHDGAFTEAWLDCMSCGESDYRGDRF